jgi:hypothetical protein
VGVKQTKAFLLHLDQPRLARKWETAEN